MERQADESAYRYSMGSARNLWIAIVAIDGLPMVTTMSLLCQADKGAYRCQHRFGKVLIEDIVAKYRLPIMTAIGYYCDTDRLEKGPIDS